VGRTDLDRVCWWVWAELEEEGLGVAGSAVRIRLTEVLVSAAAEDRDPEAQVDLVDLVDLADLAGVMGRTGGSGT
jgi:hypothetical protein